MIDVDRIKKESIGKSRGIIANLGIEVPETTQKHGPCPICGGKDRFRFDDKDGEGTWICNQCGAGDRFSLVQKALNITFIEACQRVQDVLGISDFTPHKTEKPIDYKKMLTDLWKSSVPLTGSDPVSIYLHGRGLMLTPDNVRWCKDCYESETKTRMDAMVARVISADMKGITIHRTYLKDGKKADIESPKKLMPHNGNMKGSTVPLFKPRNGTLGVAEGIESALAAAQLFDQPVWACLSATILESFIPPQDVKKVIVFGDNDATFTGQKSAYKLANELYVKHDRIVDVQIPETPGWDWADALKHSLSRQP